MMKNHKLGRKPSYTKLYRCFHIRLRVWCILGRQSVVIIFTPEATICIIKSKMRSLKQSIKLICDMLYAGKYVLPN